MLKNSRIVQGDDERLLTSRDIRFASAVDQVGLGAIPLGDRLSSDGPSRLLHGSIGLEQVVLKFRPRQAYFRDYFAVVARISEDVHLNIRLQD
jgi:hypothetical protein